jgi:serine protease
MSSRSAWSFAAFAVACLPAGAIASPGIPGPLGLQIPQFAEKKAAKPIFASRSFAGTIRTLIERSNIALAKPTSAVIPGYVLVKFRPSQAAKLSADRQTMRGIVPTALKGATFRNQIAKTGWTVWNLPVGEDPVRVSEQILASQDALYAQPMHRITPMLATPNDADYDVWETTQPMVLAGEGVTFRRLWYLDDVGGLAAWEDWPNEYIDGANRPTDVPTIAVIDSGCDMDHPDFINPGGTGTDVSEGGQFIKEESKLFSFGEIVPGGVTEDVLGHGTHVSGLALAAANNGGTPGGAEGNGGIIGMGYPCKGVILRVFDDNGSGSDADAAGALFYAADKGYDILNLSLGTKEYSQIFQDAVTYASEKGSLVVAAGNESGSGGGDLGPIYPAACSGAIAVTANGPDGQHASDYYAGTGSYLDVAAPGGNFVQDLSDLENIKVYAPYIYSTTPRNDNVILNNPNVIGYYKGYGYLVGTSMATPLVAGMMGLYYGKNNLRATDGRANIRAERALERSAVSVYGAPKGSWEPTQGFGTVFAPALLQDYDTRTATAGAIEGILYLNGVAQSNVKVNARKVGSTFTFVTTTNAVGMYRFDALPPGTFEVWSAPGGFKKTKFCTVVTGSNRPGFNFWCGTYTGDETGPTIRNFEVMDQLYPSSGPTALKLKINAFDPETSIDKVLVRLGTAPGLGDIAADKEAIVEDVTVDFPVASLPLGQRTFLTLTATNGAGMVQTASTFITPTGIEWDAAFVSGTPPASVAKNTSFAVTLKFKNTGQNPWRPSARNRMALVGHDGSWGMTQVNLPPGVSVLPGEEFTISVRCKAPATTGSYPFVWQMRRNGERFGATSTVGRTITVN